MITNQNINELMSITMKDLPLPPIEDMLSIPCDSDFDIDCIVFYFYCSLQALLMKHQYRKCLELCI